MKYELIAYLRPRGKKSDNDKNPMRLSSIDHSRFAIQLFRSHESLDEFKTI